MTTPQSSGSENIVLKLDAIAQDYEALIHFTPTADQRRAFASSGWAMPDGSFFIRPLPQGSVDLDNAISAVGRATPNAGESDVARRNAVRRHIMKRARAIGQSNKIPDSWNSDGSLKQSAILVQEIEEFLQHFGVKGMKWGVRRGDNAGSGGGGSSNHPSLNAPKSRISSDADLARNLQTQVRRSGTQSLSNKELQQLVTRLNLERQYGQVSQAQVGQGRKFVTGLLLSIGKQTAATFAQKYAAQGVEALIKKASKK